MIGPTRLLLIAVLAWVGLGSGDAIAADKPPATKYWEGEHLAELRRNPDGVSQTVRESLDDLREAADRALDSGPYSVMDKTITPPSGDKHDYLSYSRYWWPNPDTDDGLPFVRKDGVVNRGRVAMGDRVAIGSFCEDFAALSLAAYLIDEDRYAPHAVRLLRVWFLDPATRMNPNLKFAQGVPGRAEGRAPGVLDARHFIHVLDGVALLDAIGAIDESDHEKLRRWFTEFLDWLLTSELGRQERRATNNHGAWYAGQAGRIALFAGRDDVARELVEETRDRRLVESIEPDGAQPDELERTMSLHYSLFSLAAYTCVARLGEEVGIDLWDTQTLAGERLVAAIDYATPFAANADGWKHPMIERYAVSDRQAPLFYLAASRLGDPKYLGYLEKAPTRYDGQHLTPLLFSDTAAKSAD